MSTNYKPQVLQPGVQLGTAMGDAIPAQATSALLRAVAFANASASGLTISVNIVRADGTSTPIIPSRTMQGSETYVARELQNQVLRPGDKLQASATTAGQVSVVASGLVF